MLKDNLYKIISSEQSKSEIIASIELDKTHDIFNGHFTGNPVMPGACMLQMVKEVLEHSFVHSYRLIKADQMKFPFLVDPAKEPILQLQIAYKPAGDKTIHVTASLSANKNTCFKFKGTLIEV